MYSVWSFVLLLSHVFLEYINLTYKGLTVQAFLPIAKDTKGKINLVYAILQKADLILHNWTKSYRDEYVSKS